MEIRLNNTIKKNYKIVQLKWKLLLWTFHTIIQYKIMFNTKIFFNFEDFIIQILILFSAHKFNNLSLGIRK